MPPSPVELLLARRPETVGQAAFGHVDVTRAGREGLEDVVDDAVRQIEGLTEIDFNPDDRAEDGEILTAPLRGFDDWYQAQAPWSLERVVDELRNPGLPDVLDEEGIRHGRWGFYAIRVPIENMDIIVVRAKSPTWGLTSNKFFASLVGTQLQPVTEPLLAFDRTADLIVVDDTVHVLNPGAVERLFVDADAIKARADRTTASFGAALAARVTNPTLDAIQAVISHNANVGRRVEKLVRSGVLPNVTAAGVRAALPDAGLQLGDFGASGPLQAVTPDHATKLIEIAADLYYQPRFESSSRKVAYFRRLPR
jgi:hypothetical protein